MIALALALALALAVGTHRGQGKHWPRHGCQGRLGDSPSPECRARGDKLEDSPLHWAGGMARRASCDMRADTPDGPTGNVNYTTAMPIAMTATSQAIIARAIATTSTTTTMTTATCSHIGIRYAQTPSGPRRIVHDVSHAIYRKYQRTERP